MKQDVLKILNSIRADVDYENESALIDDGILDSFDVAFFLCPECFLLFYIIPV